MGEITNDIFRVKTQIRLGDIEACHPAAPGALEERHTLCRKNELHGRRQLSRHLLNQLVDGRGIGNVLEVVQHQGFDTQLAHAAHHKLDSRTNVLSIQNLVVGHDWQAVERRANVGYEGIQGSIGSIQCQPADLCPGAMRHGTQQGRLAVPGRRLDDHEGRMEMIGQQVVQIGPVVSPRVRPYR